MATIEELKESEFASLWAVAILATNLVYQITVIRAGDDTALMRLKEGLDKLYDVSRKISAAEDELTPA